MGKNFDHVKSKVAEYRRSLAVSRFAFLNNRKKMANLNSESCVGKSYTVIIENEIGKAISSGSREDTAPVPNIFEVDYRKLLLTPMCPRNGIYTASTSTPRRALPSFLEEDPPSTISESDFLMSNRNVDDLNIKLDDDHMKALTEIKLQLERLDQDVILIKMKLQLG